MAPYKQVGQLAGQVMPGGYVTQKVDWPHPKCKSDFEEWAARKEPKSKALGNNWRWHH